MYFPHPNNNLHGLFTLKPYQGADPAAVRFLFKSYRHRLDVLNNLYHLHKRYN